MRSKQSPSRKGRAQEWLHVTGACLIQMTKVTISKGARAWHFWTTRGLSAPQVPRFEESHVWRVAYCPWGELVVIVFQRASSLPRRIAGMGVDKALGFLALLDFV